MRCNHISYSKGLSDGGISSSVSSIIEAQDLVKIKSTWNTTKDTKSNSLSNIFTNQKEILFHIHGLWRSPTRYTSINKISNPYVISTHGMLSKWALKKSFLKKKLALFFWENKSLINAKCVHALSIKEMEDIKNINKNIPVAVIPNCIKNNYSKYESIDKDNLRSISGIKELGINKNDKILLYLGRFHKGKNIELLLEVWFQLNLSVKEKSWKLLIVGDGEIKKKLISLKEKYPSFKYNWHILEPRFGKEKFLTYYCSDAFILCSDSEGLPMSPLEAMSTGLYCLLTEECNLYDFIDKKLALLISKDKLKSSLLALFNQDSHERDRLKKSIKQHLNKNYSQLKIGNQYLELYKWILKKGNKPEFVF